MPLETTHTSFSQQKHITTNSVPHEMGCGKSKQFTQISSNIIIRRLIAKQINSNCGLKMHHRGPTFTLSQNQMRE